MAIAFDPAKRDLALRHRGLDFVRAGEVFAGRTASVVDDRFDYGETRLIPRAISMGGWWSWSGRSVARIVTSSQ